MATAAPTIAVIAPASPAHAFASAPAEQGWADQADVRAIAAAIVACDGISAKLARLPDAHDAARSLGMIGTAIGLSPTSRMRIAVARPSTVDSVLGELWTVLEDARSAWIKSKLNAAGLAGVWDDPDASREDCIRAHEMEGELESLAPTVADVIGVTLPVEA